MSRTVYAILCACMLFHAAMAQTDCSSATNLTTPFEITEPSLEDLVEPSFFDAVFGTECESGLDLSATTDIGSGRWFRYSPSTQIIVRNEIVESGSSRFGAPWLNVFRGTCTALRCVDSDGLLDYDLFQANPGQDYFFYLYIPEVGGVNSPYRFTVQEIPPPDNDDMQNAIVITTLPHIQEYTRYGALSDLNSDACGLRGDVHGVWFVYTPTVPERLLVQVLRSGVFSGGSPTHGIQERSSSGASFTCVARWMNTNEVELDVYAGMEYYFLISAPTPRNANDFELRIRSLGVNVIPTPSPVTGESRHVCQPTTNSINNHTA